MKAITAEALRTIAGVDSRFFIVDADGTIHSRNDFGKCTRWAFNQKASAFAWANRTKRNVYDKQQSRFIEQ